MFLRKLLCQVDKNRMKKEKKLNRQKEMNAEHKNSESS